MQKLTKVILSTVCMMGFSILHAENSDDSAAAKDALLQQMDDKQGNRCVQQGGCNVKQGNRAVNRGFREGNQGCGNANSGKGKSLAASGSES